MYSDIKCYSVNDLLGAQVNSLVWERVASLNGTTLPFRSNGFLLFVTRDLDLLNKQVWEYRQNSDANCSFTMRLIGLLLILTACFGSQDSKMVRHYFVAQTVPELQLLDNLYLLKNKSYLWKKKLFVEKWILFIKRIDIFLLRNSNYWL